MSVDLSKPCPKCGKVAEYIRVHGWRMRPDGTVESLDPPEVHHDGCGGVLGHAEPGSNTVLVGKP